MTIERKKGSAMSARIWLGIAALLGASAVAIGAYHAHGLEKMLTKQGLEPATIAERLAFCETGVQYQMYHALALLAVAIMLARQPSMLLNIAGIVFLLGLAGFSGGLYFVVFGLPKLHWAVIPAGGSMLIVGWLLLAASAFRLQVD